MKIVLGLGNPGVRYRLTRHNLGFRVVDRLAERAGRGGGFHLEQGGKAWTTGIELSGAVVILAKPRTYMNRSGAAALFLCRRYDALPSELLVVYDDADLELGRLRLRTKGRAAGHRGVRSISEALGTDEFPRLKLGVRGENRKAAELTDYVLEEFESEEIPVAEEMIGAGAAAIEEVFERGFGAAMNRFNKRSAPELDEEEPPGSADPGPR